MERAKATGTPGPGGSEGLNLKENWLLVSSDAFGDKPKKSSSMSVLEINS